MNGKKQKLELTWIGKDDGLKLEPRILIEDPKKSHGDLATENMLIHGDNLLALKALEKDFTGRIKCIYIDPPYNTGEAFLEYDDSKEHSIWLSLMRDRFVYLNTLLADEGVFFIQLNDEEMAYCKVLLDEIFGRKNFINQVAIKTKNTAGASGGGEDKRLKKNVESILIYAKDYEKFQGFNEVYDEEDLFKLIEDMEESGKSWKYTSVLLERGKFIEERVIKDGSGDPIRVRKFKGLKRTTINRLVSSGKTIEDAYASNFDNIFSDTNAQSSIRARVIEEFNSLSDDELLVVNYVPKTGRDKGIEVEHCYISPTIRRVIWLKDSAEKRNSTIIKKEKIGTYWSGFNWNNVNKEGGVVFTGGKKPESLVRKVIDIATSENDWVLDSFLGSGTTIAVAHKMKRKWIGVELGDHANTLCYPRLKNIVDGNDQTGISEVVGWKGGGGFKFYKLAPSLLRKDKFNNWIIDEKYNANMLAAAMCKHEGFVFFPDIELYWKQGKSTESDYIFVTTAFMTVEQLDQIHSEMKKGESLLICAKSFAPQCKDRHNNITIKKIPQLVLGKCEFGKDNYDLNIVNSPQDNNDEDLESDDQEQDEQPKVVKETKAKSRTTTQKDLFKK